jgi:cyanophycinase-like exopeptidase
MNKPKSVYLLAGGRGSANKAIFKAILEELGKPNPLIAYVGVANDDDAGFFRFMEGEIAKAGACTVRQVLIASPRADLEKAGHLLGQADAVFMSGGDVEAGINTLKAKGMFAVFQELRLGGKLFFGASAGSIMLGEQWVKWHDPHDDSSAELFECLGVAPVICDTHAEEDDWVELKAALQLKEDKAVGYGIPSGGCLMVRPDGRVEALGKPVERYARKGRRIARLDDVPLTIS